MPKQAIAPPQLREGVSANAVDVATRLRAAGFSAFVVGGAVRDLLLGRTPKDFDVATDARPDDICAVFPRSRVVGRRFRIVHVRFRRPRAPRGPRGRRDEVIEVSTFRRAHDAAAAQPGDRAYAGDLLVRDNVYGAIDEDAFRRDFTVNALYYDPLEDRLLDYCGGLADIATRTLRLIGAPGERFREDPVRMLRTIRLAAKLDMVPHRDTQAAIAPHRHLLEAVPAARLFDEFGKMFLNGHGAPTFDLLHRHGLVDTLFPVAMTDTAMPRRALANTDARVREDKPVTAGFLLAALLWGDYAERTRGCDQLPREERDLAVEAAAQESFSALRTVLAIPRRHDYFARGVWQLQPHLERRRPDDVASALAHRRFRAAYDFLLLRAELEEVPRELAEWWTEAQERNAPEALEPPTPRKRQRRRRSRRGRSAEPAWRTANAAEPPPTEPPSDPIAELTRQTAGG